MQYKISLQEARLLALRNQWLTPATSLHGKEGILSTIEQLGYVQIDTLAVVERAHHHTLWSRLPDYRPEGLTQLNTEKKIFEYWSHAASYLPMRDYRFSLVRKRAYSNGKSHWFEQDKRVKAHVLRRIKREGSLQSKDFEDTNEIRGTWYYWKPAKRALEQLFMEGKLMVSHRQGFQKVYDLSERILPGNINTSFPSKNEYAEYLVMSAIRSHGIVTENEIHYQRGAWNDFVKKAIKKLVKEEVVVPLVLEGYEKVLFYSDLKSLEQLPSVLDDHEIHILSPFDNLLIQRKRTQRLFGFDFVIECYVPEHKRKFGYFSLPVLHRDQFIARMDPKADRLNKIFNIRNLTFEKGWKKNEETLTAFAQKLKKFSLFNGCERIIIESCTPKLIKREIEKLLERM